MMSKPHPFPPGFYLRKQDFQAISTIAQSGKAVEIVGGDGDGKSTLTSELERYIRHHGGQAARIDIRHFLNVYSPPEVLESYITLLSSQTGKTRPILIIDNADELWFIEKKHGKSLAQLKASRRLGRLAKYEESELKKMELKEAYIDWLARNKQRVGIVLTAHDENTTAVKNYQDHGLRNKFEEGLRPYKDHVLYIQYTPQEAAELLKHLGITSPALIEIITETALSHKELKAVACLRISGKRIQEVLNWGSERQPILASTKQTFSRIIKTWLATALETQ